MVPDPEVGAVQRAARDDAELTLRAGIEVLRWPALDELGVQAVVTTRHGGVSAGPYATLNLGAHVGDDPSAVVTNRARAAAAVGLGLDELVLCRQTHGRVVVEVGPGDRGRGARDEADAVPGADALVTSATGVGLVVMVADCVPVLLVDPAARVLAVVHAGWRGTVAGIVPAAVDHLVGLGADRARIVAAIGPAIAVEGYEVGDDVVSAARAAFGDALDEVVRPLTGGRLGFDLWAANRRQLTAAGVVADRVLSGERPTGDGTPFFSDRAARPCGRFALLARLTDAVG